MKKYSLIFLAFLTFAMIACDSSTPSKPSQTYIPNEWELDVMVESVAKANRINVLINGKTYTVAVADLEVFESQRNEVLASQAILAGISEDSALAVGLKTIAFARQTLEGKQIKIVRDSLYGNSNSNNEYIRHIFINGESYAEMLKSQGLAGPRKPHPDDKEFYAKVNWIYDGDTFDYRYDGVLYKVRVLGIDCYETQINDRLHEQASKNKISVDSALALGLAAKDFAMATLRNKTVLLLRTGSAPNKDVYDRYLRWVEIDGIKYDSLIKAKGYDAN